MTSWLGAIERTVAGMGYELVDAERSAGGLLRVMIDHPFPLEAGMAAVDRSTEAPAINIDDCEQVTRQLQHVLEVEGCAYERLEVSSPGVDRPLKKPSDFQRFVGEPVEITLKAPFQGRKRFRGDLQAAAEGGWRLLLADDEPAAPRPARAAAKKPPTRRPASHKKGTPAADAPRRALDFSLDEVRDARLVPVLDFKGRRFAAPAVGTDLADAPIPDDKMDGGRIQ